MAFYYRAPEVILGMDYAEKVDVWALGCIFAEMVLARIMFPGKNYVDQWVTITETLGTPDKSFMDRLESSVRRYVMGRPHCPPKSFERLFPDNKFPPPSPNHESLNAEQARDLVRRMLVIDPDYRISVEEALQHPYVNLWYDESEVRGPPCGQYDVNLYERDLTIEEYRRCIFEEIQQFQPVCDME
ncbi:unnamed protein product [Echinostoma caproni]|uniref:Stress-activated protein kinase JNK n=1 Tax=Echinostoma caproni TaxID=27848 RepID=A0A183B2D4_9TREM|nr:unnamed protein product [Echinostoma caproni]